MSENKPFQGEAYGELRVDIYVDFKEDLHRLRQLINRAGKIKDLAAPWNEEEASELYDEMLDVMDKCIKARRVNERSEKNIQPKDRQ